LSATCTGYLEIDQQNLFKYVPVKQRTLKLLKEHFGNHYVSNNCHIKEIKHIHLYMQINGGL